MIPINKKICSLIFISILMSSLITSAISFPFLREDVTLIVLDSDSTEPLPDRYRNITPLNISGSAQFTPDQLPSIISNISKDQICIVDLRQESHGFVNDIAISFYDPEKDLNNGFTTAETLKTENALLEGIKLNSPLTIYDKLSKPIKEVTVTSVDNEETIVSENNISYRRFAVKDGGIPSPTVVDEFVNFIKEKEPALHLHFHCDAGEGRTTTFMVMYQIMNNTSLSLEQILTYQINMGGINLTDDVDRGYFLNSFYEYVNNNRSSNYQTPFSQWTKTPN